MKGFSWGGSATKCGFYMIVLLGFLVYNMVLAYDIGFCYFARVDTYFLDRKSLLVFYPAMLVFCFIWSLSKRFVTVYLSSDVDTITKSQFMAEVNTGKVWYIEDTRAVEFMRTKLLFLNKEEYSIVRRRIARFESSKVKRSIKRVRLCGFNY